MKKISGIYQIQSKLKPERIYIGSTNNIHLRWGRHLYDLLKNVHRSPKLQNHYNKYGKSDLQFSILLGCEIEDLIKTEQYFLDSYKPYFNISLIASNPMLGRHHTEEAKKKMSELMIGNKRGIGNKSGTGKKQSTELIAKRVAKNTGKKRTEETKMKMSLWQKGKPKSEEAKRNMSKSQQGHKGHIPWNKGIPAYNRGISPSEETRKKLSDAHKGLQAGENHPLFGTHQSEETKKKISETKRLTREAKLLKKKLLLSDNLLN